MAKEVSKGSRITGTDRDKLSKEYAKRYRAGESIRSIQEGSGRSYGSIHKALADAGVPLRGRGGATRGAAAKKTVTKKAPAKKAVAKKASAKKAVAKKAPVKAAAKKAPAKKAVTKKAPAKKTA
ncbi:MAG: helix-turn-helix domain-containing protein, partial [Propionibacteriales bacterium]|nr:helix-turn-helix domain-containing protein [Propionibacteriales bacterium]